MPEGEGKYGKELDTVLTQIKAKAGALIVVGGERGSGFSVSGPAAFMNDLSPILRTMADEIEAFVMAKAIRCPMCGRPLGSNPNCEACEKNAEGHEEDDDERE